MGRLDKRLTELERKQEATQLKLDKLDMDVVGGGLEKKDVGRERKVILRELTDIKIRIRNLQRSKKKEVSSGDNKVCEELNTRDKPISNEIDAEDDNFDPEAVQFTHIRPEWRVYPKIPLPHSKPNWNRVVRVGRMREGTVARRTDWEGQFVGVDEEEEDTLYRRGRKWERQERNEIKTSEGFGRGREDVKLLCQLDEKILPAVLSPCASSSGQKYPTSSCKDYKSTSSEPPVSALAKKPIAKYTSILGTGEKIFSVPDIAKTEPVSQVKTSPVPVATADISVSQVIHSSIPITSTKMTISKVNKSSLMPVKSIEKAVPPCQSRPNCICYRPLQLVTCSSSSCGHSFYGRVVTTCHHHPTDHFLMDHPTICPNCKAVPLVEDRKLTSTSVPDPILTKIKSKPILERKVFTKSENKVMQMKEPKHLLVLEKRSESQISEKPPSTVPRLSVQSKCGKHQAVTQKISGLEELRIEAATAKKGTDNLVIVKAKPVTPSSVLCSPVQSGSDHLALREWLRRRLIVSKSGQAGQAAAGQAGQAGGVSR